MTSGGGGGATCRTTGNTVAYNGFLVTGADDQTLGVVQDATVDANLDIVGVRFLASPQVFPNPTCVVIGGPVEVGSGSLGVRTTADRLANSR
ncbi:hypothetical protein [Nioella nitratireducens]|uniref:hypothetical protein n=1 Tax=Nioella nitratireducens TaxID=1287720 RepID=UPI001F26E563|nr:hypothetical protein [Nioella nitratireducens]